VRLIGKNTLERKGESNLITYANKTKILGRRDELLPKIDEIVDNPKRVEGEK